MNITIKTIPNKEQRYTTIGDYWFDKKGNLEIRVSCLSDWRWEFLVALHELVEVGLVKDRKISIDKIEAFDKAYEAMRRPDNEEEPGDDPYAPYKKEHSFATCIERLMAIELGLDYPNYHFEGLK